MSPYQIDAIQDGLGELLAKENGHKTKADEKKEQAIAKLRLEQLQSVKRRKGQDLKIISIDDLFKLTNNKK